ncbi:asparagine synthetase domain protein, partial [Vibrio cholerae HC-78A1]
WL